MLIGEYEGYTNEKCEKCGRHRVEHFSEGYDICEKCNWCKQLGQYYEFYDIDESWFIPD